MIFLYYLLFSVCINLALSFPLNVDTPTSNPSSYSSIPTKDPTEKPFLPTSAPSFDPSIRTIIPSNKPYSATTVPSKISHNSSTETPTVIPTTSPTFLIILDPSFESPVLSTNYVYQPPFGWKCPRNVLHETNCVMVKSRSPEWGGTIAASGSQYVGLHGTSAYINQTISLLGNSQYILSFYASCRLYYNPAALSVTLDEMVLFTTIIPPQSTTMQYFSFNFQTSSFITQRSVLTFQNTGASGDRTVFIDAIKLVTAPSSAPTVPPSTHPTSPTIQPTTSPSTPTRNPSLSPSISPTVNPTILPTRIPSTFPTSPTKSPTNIPTRFPTKVPTMPPTTPSLLPTTLPSRTPTPKPTRLPSTLPTLFPTPYPTPYPTPSPTAPEVHIPRYYNWFYVGKDSNTYFISFILYFSILGVLTIISFRIIDDDNKNMFKYVTIFITSTYWLLFEYVLICARFHYLLSLPEGSYHPQYTHSGKMVWLGPSFYEIGPKSLQEAGCPTWEDIDHNRRSTVDECTFIVFPISAKFISEGAIKFSIGLGLIIYLFLQSICVGLELYFEKAKDEVERKEIIIWNMNMTYFLDIDIWYIRFASFIIIMMLGCQQSVVLMPLQSMQINPYCAFIETSMSQKRTMCVFKWAAFALPYGIPLGVGSVGCFLLAKGIPHPIFQLIYAAGGVFLGICSAGFIIIWLFAGIPLGIWFRFSGITYEFLQDGMLLIDFLSAAGIYIPFLLQVFNWMYLFSSGILYPTVNTTI